MEFAKLLLSGLKKNPHTWEVGAIFTPPTLTKIKDNWIQIQKLKAELVQCDNLFHKEIQQES